MIYILLLIYILLAGWWIKSSSYFAIAGLSRKFIFFIFCTKIVSGIMYGLIHLSYFDGGDTILFLSESTLIGNTLLTYPDYYIGSLLGWEVTLPTAEVFIYPESGLFWKDFGSYTLVHLHGLLHLFTFGNYDLHIFFIAIAGLFGSLNFYKLFRQVLNLPKPVLLTCCFFLPSLTFWTSGLHKDVYVYYGLSLFFLSLLKMRDELSTNNILKLATSILIIGLSRHYLLILILPATISYIITIKYTKRVLTTYLSVYSCFVVAVVLSCSFFLNTNVFEVLADKQAAFLSEKGTSSLEDAEAFAPSVWGVTGMLPMATINVFGRPFLWECKDFLQFLASIEILCFLFLVILTFLIKKKAVQRPDLILHFIVAYTISNLLLIGLLVSNVGTIVRYRAVALGLLTILITHILDFHKFGMKRSGTDFEINPVKPYISKDHKATHKTIIS
jgi:hypothetical protein